MTTQKRKYSIEIGDKLDNLLNDLSKREDTSRAEVIRRAVSLYAFLLEYHTDPAGRVSVKNKEGQTEVIKLF